MKLSTSEINTRFQFYRSNWPVGSYVRHFKGGIYLITGHCFHTEDEKVHIIYRRIAGNEFDSIKEATIEFSRPASQFSDIIKTEGYADIQRFIII
jgi:hypothetical protein